MFLVESGIIAALAASLAVALAFPASKAMNNFTATHALLIPVPLVVSRSALLILAASLPVVLIAVWVVVRRTMRVSVREALAYE